jgi:hypothetical protein
MQKDDLKPMKARLMATQAIAQFRNSRQEDVPVRR